MFFVFFFVVFFFLFSFFFQAEDGIRDVAVTGVQTCALPIYGVPASAVTDVKTVAEPALVIKGGKGTQSGTSKTACGADSIQTCSIHDKPGGYWCRSCLPEKWSTPEARAKQGITLIGEDA